MGLFGPNTPPQKGTQTLRHSDNSLGWQEKSQSGTEHATLIFIDFILTPKKATHGNLTDAVPDPQTPPQPLPHSLYSLGRPETT